jgi:Putative adhesin
MGELTMPTFDTPNPIAATVTIVGGDVRITAGDAGATTVTVEPTDTSNGEDRKAAEQTRVEYTNGQLLVRAPKLRSWLPGNRGGAVNVTIELPAGSTVHGGAALADFTATGPLAELRIKTGLGHVQIERAGTLDLKTGIGDISVDRVTGNADISSGSGEVRVRELDSAAVIKNANGSTWVGRAGGDLRVSAANGSIAIDAAQASVVAKSANGDVRLGEAVRNSVVLETSIGDLEVGIPEGTAAWLDVRAHAGKVHNGLDAAAAPAATAAEKVEVRARTTAGDVVIRRAS